MNPYCSLTIRTQWLPVEPDGQLCEACKETIWIWPHEFSFSLGESPFIGAGVFVCKSCLPLP